MLLDLLDSMGVDLFDSGCIICEVRDFRRRPGAHATSMPNACELCHVLLKPTTQSLICDSNLMLASTSSSSCGDERAALEGQLALRTQGPLCLDPSPAVALVARKTGVAMLKFNLPTLRRRATRKRKLNDDDLSFFPSNSSKALSEFVQRLNKRKKVTPQDALARHQAMARTAMRNKPLLNQAQPVVSNPPPSTTDVSRFARCIPRRHEVNDMSPHVVEEYVLETAERGPQRVYHTRLTIFQRLANEEYMGELYVERDYREGDSKGSTCRFVLGTR